MREKGPRVGARGASRAQGQGEDCGSREPAQETKKDYQEKKKKKGKPEWSVRKASAEITPSMGSIRCGR